ncbi:type I-B CRISPR-associated protein Cas5b [Aneurinibacillus uraniidurans]|uniref:type I-B CRISPR-associated protein Cas5b n=1 Tax=Aneurinibacillus uraniidurans TaxID=2966586 RepID=UPI002349FEA7|nr:type I-B CRISPR-associated protein Cas5b [Aneurinibacillus sp. B1]WCN36621.1 type I-B CRISPR-associated protein Cas5b [Aneurinibacillus sp. B1]
MKAIAFELTGKTAFFKKPDVNANAYFTYSHIHKIALYGLLGAILGLGGYATQYRDIQLNGKNEKNLYPEFYRLLRDLPVSIVPHGDRGYFAKKIQIFNNSVGYASQEEGNNLVVREQWIENPHWTVYVLDNGTEIFSRLAAMLEAGESVYLPYLGKNDHPASLSSIRMLALEWQERTERIDSLFYTEHVTYQKRGGTTDGSASFHSYKEQIPVALDTQLNSYEYKEVGFTNRKLASLEEDAPIYTGEGRFLYFL